MFKLSNVCKDMSNVLFVFVPFSFFVYVYGEIECSVCTMIYNYDMIVFPCRHCICQNCTGNIFNSVNYELKPSLNQFVKREPSQDGERVYVSVHNEINDNDDNDEEYYDVQVNITWKI